MRTMFGALIAFLLICQQLATPAKADPWTGAFAGVHAGYSWGDMNVTDSDGGVPYGAFNYKPAGIFGGVTAGYNHRLDMFVLGAEVDLGYMDMSGDRRIASSNKLYHQDATIDGSLYGDVAARIGILVTPTTLVYGKGGYGFFDGNAKQETTKPWYTASQTSNFSGFVYGGGVEQFITPSISLKVEYLHFGFGSQGADQEKTSYDPGMPGGVCVDASIDDCTPKGYKFHNEHDLGVDTIKAAVAYHF